MEFALRFLACVFITDVLSGFFHWLEDAYGRPEWPLTGPWITHPNILHHHNPRYFTKHSWLQSADILLVMGGTTLALAYCFGVLDWMTWVVVLIGVNANEIHKWAHRSRVENGRLITFLQRLGILQSPAEHAKHHRHQKNSHYCVVTNYLNPLLDGIGVWCLLEWVVWSVFGVRRRADLSLDDPNPVQSGDRLPASKRYLADRAECSTNLAARTLLPTVQEG